MAATSGSGSSTCTVYVKRPMTATWAWLMLSWAGSARWCADTSYVGIHLGGHGVRFRSLWSGAHVFVAVRDHQFPSMSLTMFTVRGWSLFKALYTGTGLGAVSTGTRSP